MINWTEDEEQTLAETVLRHIREKSTLLAAMSEASNKLNRSEDTCSSRWHKHTKDKYQVAVIHAMKIRYKKEGEYPLHV